MLIEKASGKLTTALRTGQLVLPPAQGGNWGYIARVSLLRRTYAEPHKTVFSRWR